MANFIRWVLGIGFSLFFAGHLKSATLQMAKMAVDAQKHQMSYGQFSRALTAPMPKYMH